MLFPATLNSTLCNNNGKDWIVVNAGTDEKHDHLPVFPPLLHLHLLPLPPHSLLLPLLPLCPRSSFSPLILFLHSWADCLTGPHLTFTKHPSVVKVLIIIILNPLRQLMTI